MHTIVITGGHHNSALVVAQELIKRGHKIVWIGHQRSSQGDRADSAEYLEVTSSGIPFHNLVAARLIPNLRQLLLFPLGLIRSFYLLNKIKPAAILSFGGYLGGSVGLCGKMLGIPIYLHEQTVSAGRANKLIGSLSKRIYLTWPDSAKYFPPGKTLVIGLPLRPTLLTAQPKQLFSRHRPTLLVMGGKQGAHVLNQFIFAHLCDLLSHFNLIHQTGTNSQTGDYGHAQALQNSLGSLADCYLPLGYITQSEIGSYLRSSEFYFGRSGAHICYELSVLGLPSILVPFMATHDHEQHKNAQVLVKAKLAIILPQSELSLPHFLTQLKELKKLPHQALSLPLDAASRLVDTLLADL